MSEITPRQRFIDALEGRPVSGLVPHFELVFFLTMEAFGKLHPSHRDYSQWDQMEEKERQLHRHDMADIFIATAERYGHSAIFVHPNPGTFEECARVIEIVQEKTGGRYFVMKHGDVTYGIPNGDRMLEFCVQLKEAPGRLKDAMELRLDEALRKAERQKALGGLDCYALCTDYCFNRGPFLRPDQFAEFVAPYLARLIQGYRELGFYTIKHTDGNIMPIVDQLVAANPHALHSLDPQAGVDIAEIKRRYGDRLCLIGNVNCGLMDSGTDDEVEESARYALQQGMPGGRYIFSTSNCIYTGMRLSRYELMLDMWKKEGAYGVTG